MMSVQDGHQPDDDVTARLVTLDQPAAVVEGFLHLVRAVAMPWFDASRTAERIAVDLPDVTVDLYVVDLVEWCAAGTGTERPNSYSDGWPTIPLSNRTSKPGSPSPGRARGRHANEPMDDGGLERRHPWPGLTPGGPATRAGLPALVTVDGDRPARSAHPILSEACLDLGQDRRRHPQLLADYLARINSSDARH